MALNQATNSQPPKIYPMNLIEQIPNNIANTSDQWTASLFWD